MSVIKHSTFNLLGNLVPAIVTLPAYGYLARVLGVESFGIYILAMLVIGYAGIFDAGLTRAAIREIAQYSSDKVEQYKIIACGTVSILVFGIIAAIVLKAISPWIVSLLNVSLENREEAISSVSLLALSIPIFLINQMWLSILEGNEDFLRLNIQRSIGSLFIAGVPVAMVYFEQTLYSSILGLLVARLITLVISLTMVKDDVFKAGLKFDLPVFKRMIHFGGWAALSSIISPIMVYFDRFLLSSMLGARYVAFYSAPAELISRGLIIPAALGRSIFPKLSVAKSENQKGELRKLSYKLIISICGLCTIFGLFLAEYVMTAWMGDEFGGEPVLVLQILLVGYFFTSIAQVPFIDLQARGKSKVTAMLHLSEIIPYIALLILLTNLYGIIGVAIAWTSRVFVDLLLLIYLARKAQGKDVEGVLYDER